MYENFFGFKEKPFRLVPNPAYLYLGQSHEEALAHLSYAVSQGDGFVEILGEVGTGKTTICRAFLENLDQAVEVAYIFNPKLDAVQLLKAINGEFGLNATPEDSRALIDILNAFLLAQKAAGKKVLVLIDEAQNLSREVLEQLRLLSNLETSRDKLLQIVLVGQPELGKALDSHELRQLSQRITLRCRLAPLSFKETRAYIRHRLNQVADRPAALFDQAADRAIFKYSRGIPRLINIACDRTLLYAYGLNRRKITGALARAAIRELTGRSNFGKKVVLAISLFFLGLPATLIFLRSQPANNLTRLAAAPAPLAGRIAGPLPAPTTPPLTGAQSPGVHQVAGDPLAAATLEKVLADLEPRLSRRAALVTAMALWQPGPVIRPYLDGLDDDPLFFRLAAQQNGLLVRQITADLPLLKKFNLPAVIAFHLPQQKLPVYLALCGIEGEKILLAGGQAPDPVTVDAVLLQRFWSGRAYIPWKNFLAITGTVPRNAPADAILTLKMLLQDIGFNEIQINSWYDEQARQAVRLIQQEYGLPTDGIVGSSTKIALYREKGAFPMPALSFETSQELGP